MKTIVRIICSMFVLMPFLCVTMLFFEYMFDVNLKEQEYVYVFENATIKSAYEIGDLPFIAENYIDFKDFDGNLYVISVDGKKEGGGLFSASVKHPSTFYLFYINNDIMYGIKFESDYNEPIEYTINSHTINVIVTDREDIFRVDYLLFGIISECIGIMLAFKFISITFKSKNGVEI